jgi:ATP-dependent exoDNAse (exonuclease V) beta subunit
LFSIPSLLADVTQRRSWRDDLIGRRIRITPSSADEPFPRRDTTDETPEELAQLERDIALRFGDLCHAALEYLDLSCPEEDIEKVLASPLIKRLAGEFYEEFLPELRSVLGEAIRAEFFQETILAADEVYRELPILEQVDNATLSGRIDLAARIGEDWIVVDFKTDREVGTMEELLARYGGQKTAYVGALRRALKLDEDPVFYLYFLRFFKAIQL